MPILSSLITVGKGAARPSVCLAEWADQGPWGTVGHAVLDGDQIRAVCRVNAGKRQGLEVGTGPSCTFFGFSLIGCHVR